MSSSFWCLLLKRRTWFIYIHILTAANDVTVTFSLGNHSYPEYTFFALRLWQFFHFRKVTHHRRRVHMQSPRTMRTDYGLRRVRWLTSSRRHRRLHFSQNDCYSHLVKTYYTQKMITVSIQLTQNSTCTVWVVRIIFVTMTTLMYSYS